MEYKFKKLVIVTNHKTDNQAIEYRLYKDVDIFKTCSPRAWLTLDIEDKTTDKDIELANVLLVTAKIKNSFRDQVDLNVKVKEYIGNCMTRHDAYHAYAVQNKITQYKKRNDRVVAYK